MYQNFKETDIWYICVQRGVKSKSRLTGLVEAVARSTTMSEKVGRFIMNWFLQIKTIKWQSIRPSTIIHQYCTYMTKHAAPGIFKKYWVQIFTLSLGSFSSLKFCLKYLRWVQKDVGVSFGMIWCLSRPCREAGQGYCGFVERNG